MTPGPDLPRWDIVVEAWRLLIEYSGVALRNALLPFLMLLAVHRLIDIVGPQGFQVIGWALLKVAVFPIPAALLLVPWYRLILSTQRPELAERPASWWYVAFMIRTLGLELLLFGFQLPSAAAWVFAVEGGGEPDRQLVGLGFILFLVALAPGFYLYGRAGLALPAAAGGGDDTYSRSWRVTEGAGWRIGGIVFVVWLMFLVISWMMTGVPPGIAASAIAAAIDVARELAMAAALALVYLHYQSPRRT